MTDIVDDDVIRLAKWHENEAVRLRKHAYADMASTHGLAEMHGETASVLYMLLADRDAAIMDADMQAREAGNMEHNARVLMDEIKLLDELWHEYHDDCVLQLEENDRLRDIVRDLLSVMPVLPAAAKHIVGMEDRYNSAITNARTALGKDRQ
jgi:hypothetical protein